MATHTQIPKYMLAQACGNGSIQDVSSHKHYGFLENKELESSPKSQM